MFTVRLLVLVALPFAFSLSRARWYRTIFSGVISSRKQSPKYLSKWFNDVLWSVCVFGAQSIWLSMNASAAGLNFTGLCFCLKPCSSCANAERRSASIFFANSLPLAPVNPLLSRISVPFPLHPKPMKSHSHLYTGIASPPFEIQRHIIHRGTIGAQLIIEVIHTVTLIHLLFGPYICCMGRMAQEKALSNAEGRGVQN